MRAIPVLFTLQMLLGACSLVTAARWLAPRRFRTRARRVALWLGALGLWLAMVLFEALARPRAPAGGGVFRVPIAAQRSFAFGLLCVGLALLVARLCFAASALARRLAGALRGRRARRGFVEASVRAQEPPEPLSAPSPPEAAAPPEATVASAPAGPVALTRRELAQRAVAAGATLAAGGFVAYGARWRGREVRVREFEVYVPGLPAALEGLELVQLTDIHVGVFAGPRDYQPVVEHVARLRPDFVLLTGDLLDHRAALVPEAMALFARTRGRRGTLAIAGNHDHYTGIDDVLAGLRGAGLTALDNDAVFLPGGGASRDSGLVFAGLDDVYAARYRRGRTGPDLDRALRSVPRDAPRVVLSHNPVTYRTLAPRCALQLSGHTHGGQINVGGVAGLALPYVSGFYEEAGSLLFVSNGLGFTGPPVRVAAPAEVVRLGLTGRAGRGVRPGALPSRAV